MYEKTLIWLLLTPLIFSIIIFAMRWLRSFSRRLFSHLTVEVFHLLSVLLVLVLSLVVVQGVLVNGNIFALNNWLHVDALAALFLLIISIVGFLVGLYSLGYIRHELDTGEFDENKLCNYYGLYSLFLFTMLMVVTANNIIMMWVAVEATTLGSTFFPFSFFILYHPLSDCSYFTLQHLHSLCLITFLQSMLPQQGLFVKLNGL